jgi:hypothetical protein
VLPLVLLTQNVAHPAHISELPHASLLALYRYYLGWPESKGESVERVAMEQAVAAMIGVKA